jgi:nucleoside-diphosphate-sugar epimerase
LITGANGFIGSRLCALFLKEGYRVIAGVRRTSDLSLLKDLAVEYRFGDVTDADSIPSMVRDVDYIIHNAGVVKAKSQATFFAVNAIGTAQLMSGILEYNQNVKKVVLVSSMAAAGPSLGGVATTEADQPHPMTVYGASKLAGEREFLKHTADLNLAILRPSGVYGPGDKELLTVFQTARRGIRPCFGNTKRRLQLVHVDDLCRGILCAVRKETRSGEAYFIAEKTSYSMAELVSLVCQAVGRRGFPLVVPGPLFRLIAAMSEFSFQVVGATPMLTREKAGELLASWEISTDKARRDLGFESQISFEVGAKQTYEWYRQHGWMK